MKSKIVTLLIALSCLTMGAMAQAEEADLSQTQQRRTNKIKDEIVREKHHSLRIGYGAVAPFYRFRMYDPAYYQVESYYRGAEILSGVVFAEYSYRPLRWFEVGLHVGYINLSRPFYDRITDRQITNHTLNTLSFAAHVRFSYFTRPIVRLYSGVAIGATVGFEQMKIKQQTYNSTNLYFNGSITLFGVTVGRRIYGFAELAVGTMGIFNFGIGYRFKSN